MSNSYYNHTTYPTPNSPGASAQMRNELEYITAGFNLLPTLASNGYKVAMVNSAGTALIASAALQALAITSSTIDSTPIGATTAASGRFAGLTVASGSASLGSSVTIAGGVIDNTVIGGTTRAAGSFTTLSANAGISGTLTGNVTGDVTGNLTGNVTGDVTGNVTASSGTSTFTNVTINGTLDMNSSTGNTITGLSTPTGDTDAANKGYVDSVAQGLDAKASCVVATTASITLSGTQTIDGVAVSAGDRVLVKDQSTTLENGIYVASASAWSRSTDADTWTELVSAFTFVEKGTTNADSGWVCTVDAGGTLGTTAVTWVQFSGAGQITAGAGMTKTGNTLNVGTASTSRIVVNADDIDLASGVVTIGTYKSVTVDTYGRVTAGTNPTTLSGFGITDTYTKTEIDSIFGSTTSAAASATAAATSATNASNSATAAAGSATSASGSATTTLGYLNSFRGQYYGALSADPTLDPVGNVPTTGDLYFNSSALIMKVYDGSAWNAAYIPTAGYLALSGGTMTGVITYASAQTTPAINGGTGQTSYTVGNLLYASSTTALSKLAIGTPGQALIVNGSSLPSWGTAGVSAGKAIAFAMVMGF